MRLLGWVIIRAKPYDQVWKMNRELRMANDMLVAKLHDRDFIIQQALTSVEVKNLKRQIEEERNVSRNVAKTIGADAEIRHDRDGASLDASASQLSPEPEL